MPYYIGRGCGYRISDKTNRVIKPKADGSNVRIVKDMLSLEQANELEIALIAFWGRSCLESSGVLRNMQDGGLGGSPGRPMTEKQKEIMRNAHLGRKQDEEWIRKRTAHKKKGSPTLRNTPPTSRRPTGLLLVAGGSTSFLEFGSTALLPKLRRNSATLTTRLLGKGSYEKGRSYAVTS